MSTLSLTLTSLTLTNERSPTGWQYFWAQYIAKQQQPSTVNNNNNIKSAMTAAATAAKPTATPIALLGRQVASQSPLIRAAIAESETPLTTLLASTLPRQRTDDKNYVDQRTAGQGAAGRGVELLKLLMILPTPEHPKAAYSVLTALAVHFLCLLAWSRMAAQNTPKEAGSGISRSVEVEEAELVELELELCKKAILAQVLESLLLSILLRVLLVWYLIRRLLFSTIPQFSLAHLWIWLCLTC